MGAQSSLSVYADIKGVAMVAWGLYHVALYKRLEAMRTHAGSLLSGLFTGVVDHFALYDPSLTEFADIALLVSEGSGAPHLDVVMTRTPEGSAIARASRADVPLPTLAADGALLQAHLPFDLTASLQRARADGYADPIQQMRAPGSNLIFLTRPVSLSKPVLQRFFDEWGDFDVKGGRVVLFVDKDAPRGLAWAGAVAMGETNPSAKWVKTLDDRIGKRSPLDLIDRAAP